MNQSTLFRSQRVRWITLALLLAAFAALLTTSFALAQSDSKTLMYAENGTGPVANLAAMDPEGDDFTWDVSGGYDMDYFEIDEETGVLSFKMPPDFEDPQDNGSNNSYVVEVTATDTEENTSKTFTVTVEVTEVAEMGEVTWTIDGMDLVQFEVGAELVASLTDGDVAGSSKVPDPVVWQWYRSDSMTDMGTAISGETNDSYAATSDDVGKYIRVVATYAVGGGDDETAYRVSEYPVLAEREDNNAPEFSSTSVAMEVDEGMKGMTVGDPVTATDDGPGQLTYGLGGDDAAKFAIDRKTGQITTKVDLDHEAKDGEDANCATRNECEVTVTAYDSAGDGSEEATVTITINNVNGAPNFIRGPKTIQTKENRKALHSATDTPPTADSDVTYEATDPEGGNVNLSLRGDDRLRFELSETGVLSFKAAPDFEKPTDKDRDNVYEVTVRASDSTERTDRTEHTDRMVTVTVVNVNEAPVISGDDRVSYAENGTGPVFTFKATDPEADTPIRWSIVKTDAGAIIDAAISIDGEEVVSVADATDFDHFAIDSKGVLTFTPTSPNFEAPSGEGATSNTYKVAVAACDVALEGTAPNMICPANEATSLTNPAMDRKTSYHTVTVTVTDVSEKPKITLHAGADNTGKQLRQFDQAGPGTGDTPGAALQIFAEVNSEALRTTVGAGDSYIGTGTGAAWQWYRSKSRSSIGDRIPDETAGVVDTPLDYSDSSAQSYTLKASDVGYYIHVVRTYVIDAATPTATTKTVSAVTELPVAPYRTDGDPRTDGSPTVDNNDPPTFNPDATSTTAVALTRSVKEGAKGMKVGAPVIGKDDANRPLYYELVDTSTDAAMFAIDSKTGQITTALDLDYEATAVATADAAGGCSTAADRRECTVTVTVTDSANRGITPTARTDGTVSDGQVQATVTITINNVNERPGFDNASILKEEIAHEENQTALDHSSYVELSEVTFTATDPEDGNVTYTLRGADVGKFQLDSGQVLSFKAKPDFEMPMDRNKDNIYEVTVRASDDSNLHTEHTVKITVTNVNEAPNITGATSPEEPAEDRDGKVTLSAAPMAGKAVTARLSDPDDPVESTVMWQWSKSMTMDGDFADIAGATSSSYTPMAADEGYYLRATANYDDGHGMDKMAYGTTTAAVAAGIPADLARFDTSGNGGIEIGEVLDAIDAYLDGGEGAPTQQEILDLIDFYFDS